jgi:hypothetical protein
MSTTRTKDLLSKLKTSLPKPAAKAKPEKTTAPSARAAKLSVSLYDPDLVRLDAIKTFMGERGYRNISDSEALRLACRLAEIDDRLVDIYLGMRQEDGRSKKKADVGRR